MPSTLKLNREQQVKLPVGGEGFANTPLIGRWIAAVMYKFMTETDMNMFTGFGCDASQKKGDWFHYYYADYEQAKHWNSEAKNKYPPTGVWVVQAVNQDVLNLADESRDKWGEVIVFDHCEIVTPASKKYRHALHMISLPSAVSAYARSEGWDVPEFDVHELIDPNTEFTDDFQAYMVGDPDAKKDDFNAFQVAHDLAMAKFGDQAAEVVRRLVLKMPTDGFGDIPEPVIIEAKGVGHIHYEWSVLWERRAALWKLLGSDDPLPYRPAGTAQAEDKPKNEKYDAPANSQLNEALDVLAYAWSDYAWCKVLGVNDPRVDATLKTGQQLNIPAIIKFYGSEDEARAEAAAELAAREAGEDGEVAAAVAATPTMAPVATTTTELPPVPEAWTGFDANWKAEVVKIKTQYPGPLPVFTQQLEQAQAAGTLYDEHACTAAEVLAWLPFV